MAEAIQQHPAYHEGFFDALNIEPLFPDASSEYRAGWEAAWQARGILAALSEPVQGEQT